jgi:aspartyl protease family protein
MPGMRAGLGRRRRGDLRNGLPAAGRGDYPARRPGSGLRRPNPMRSRWIWLLVASILIGVVAMAAHVAPGALDDKDRRLQLVYLCVVLAVLSAGLAARLQARPGTTVSHLGIWCVLFAALILIYSYRDEFAGLRDRFTAELLPGRGVQTGAGSIAFPLEADGHYHVYATVDGANIGFLVDSGASDVVLSPSDARLLGLKPEYLSYSTLAETANGEVRGAPIQISKLQIGPIVMRGVPATVNQADMSVSLLGMEFLRRLKSWRVENGRLTFEQ